MEIHSIKEKLTVIHPSSIVCCNVAKTPNPWFLSWSYTRLRFGRSFSFHILLSLFTPIETFLLFPFHVLVPYGCVHSPFWWLYCSRWLMPRTVVLGGSVFTTISITLGSVVVSPDLYSFLSCNNHSLPCEFSLPCICLYLAVEASSKPRIHWTTNPLPLQHNSVHTSCNPLTRKSHNNFCVLHCPVISEPRIIVAMYRSSLLSGGIADLTLALLLSLWYASHAML